MELDGDRPKLHLADDRLGYAGFSRAIADAIHGMVPSEGIVLAINGPWGSGKTSAVNMALEALEELQRGTDDGRRIEVVYFNPWWFSAQEDLVRAFFHDVAATLEHTGISKRVVDGLKAVGRRASGAKDLLLAGLELVPGGAVVKGVAGGALDLAGKAAGGGKSLAAERDALCDALRSQSRRVLVVIDDVDRLPPDEARQIFRMVKSVADLPNMIHLLVFDQDVARAATGSGADRDRPGWLEKVVQAAFDLPPVQPADLLDLFLGELERLARPGPFIDRVRWGNTLHEAVAPWLTSPRDVRRLVNALAVSWRPVAAEVDFADFVALETMRLFEPDLHAHVRRSQDDLVGDGRSSTFSRGAGDTERAFADGLLGEVRPARRDAAKEALQRIFPRLERAWHNRGPSGSFVQRDRERRACVERHFPAYFGFDIGEGALRRSEADAALADLRDAAALHDRAAAYAQVRRKSGGTKAAVLLEELRARTADIPLESVGAAVRSIAGAADAFCNTTDNDSRGVFSIPPIWRVWATLEEVLRRLPVERRGQVLEDALVASPWLLVHSFAVRALAQEHGRDPEHRREASEDPLVEEAVLDRLQTLLLDRLRSSAGGDLLRQRPLITLLLHWGELAPEEEEEVRAWTAARIETDEGAAALGRAAVQTGRIYTDGDRVGREHLTVNRDILAKVLDVDRLETRLSGMAGDSNTAALGLLERFRTGLRTHEP